MLTLQDVIKYDGNNLALRINPIQGGIKNGSTKSILVDKNRYFGEDIGCYHRSCPRCNIGP